MFESRIITQQFEYTAPATVEDALATLADAGTEARIMAGGTDLLVQLKQGQIKASHIVDISRISELSEIEERPEGLWIGATVTLTRLLTFLEKRDDLQCLTEALYELAKVQIRNVATLAGNLCNASPAADSAPPLLALGARVSLADRYGQRELDLIEFFEGVRKTALRAGEMMKKVLLPTTGPNNGNAFMKLARVGSDISKVTCAVSLERDGDTCLGCRVALGAVASTPMRCSKVEAKLKGVRVDRSVLQEAAMVLRQEIAPIDDSRSSAEYRREVAGVLFEDVFSLAWERSGKGSRR